MHLSKRVALITGAAQGIGRAIALRLADDGFDIAINDLPERKDLLDALGHEIFDEGRKVCRILGDVSVANDVEAMIACVVEDLGGLDVIVANAGIFLWKSLLETSVDDWDRIFATNARGMFLCYKYAAQQMITQGRGGRIIGASSVTGKRGEPQKSAYSAAEFAIRGLTQSAAAELGPHGITVNAYAPGAIDTPVVHHISEISEKKETLFQEEAEDSAVKYIGSPVDVANLVSYLASVDARFITGQSISVNGGRFFD